MTVKTRRQGNSIMITIPASFNIQENIEYQPIIDENGVISLMPVRHNIFKDNLTYDLRKAIENESIGDNGTPIGQEDVWHEQ
jgi:antitoxin component of MazEF toxin-antitoxin module